MATLSSCRLNYTVCFENNLNTLLLSILRHKTSVSLIKLMGEISYKEVFW